MHRFIVALVGLAFFASSGLIAACRTASAPPPAGPAAPVAGPALRAGGISAALFRHHFIADDLPGDGRFGWGVPSVADFDGDGRPDYSVGVRDDNVYWFGLKEGKWVRHTVGPMPPMLAGLAIDVDRDGRPDIVTGRYWYHNDGGGTFTRLEYDPEATTEVHDLVAADVNGDGREDLVALGDKIGLYWTEIPADPRATTPWRKHLVTDDVLVGKEWIHSGFFPRGAADLDGDGDVDIVAARYWYENEGRGASWRRHELPFSRKKGPWGWSARSWIVDMNGDGHPDIVMTDSDQNDSRAAVLFGDGARPPKFEVFELPKTAPGIRGSFHSLAVVDFDGDGDLDIFTVEQEDGKIFPTDATPRWYIWENLDGSGRRFAERVIFDGKLGGHDAYVADFDGDGDLDIVSKIWARWPGNANGGREHVDFMENLSR
jgi:hypothetical protein